MSTNKNNAVVSKYITNQMKITNLSTTEKKYPFEGKGTLVKVTF